MSQYCFDNIIGQETAVLHLRNALRTRQISQAYLFAGERGCGGMELAMTFASALQCAGTGEERPCGSCRSCRLIAAGAHPDVIVVTNERAGAETKTKTVGVKTARFVQADVGIRPYEGPYKIYILPEAHTMNQQAQNALLKTLEEPPAYAVFLLLAENTSLFLPTVLSRCVTIPLRAASENTLLAALGQREITGERALICARLSHGNPGRCLQLAQDEKLEKLRVSLMALLKRMPEVSSYEIVQFAENLPAAAGEGRDAAGDVMDMVLSWFRDILLCKRTKMSENLIFRDEVPYIKTVAAKLSYETLRDILRAVDEAAQRRLSKGNDTRILEVLLLNIRQAMRTA